MGTLKKIEENIKINPLGNISSNKYFLDSKQHNFPGKKSKLTFGQRSADRLTSFGGSWPFILLFLGFLVIWMYVNVKLISEDPFDPFPFILLNLVLSCLAAIQAPIILMSQNRSSERDRIRAEYDYSVNRLAEKEIRNIQKDLEIIKKTLKIKN